MKFSLFITQECNLRCSYCYIKKKPVRMTINTAKQAIEFIFKKSRLFHETINIGWFGGEPLLEFELMKKFTNMVKEHPEYSPDEVVISVVSNGTLFTEEIGMFFKENGIVFGISCDGPPLVQNKFRKYRNGKESSKSVEKTIIQAKEILGHVMVNAVFTPATIQNLPDSIRYFSRLGVRQIYLSPDYSAYWDDEDFTLISKVYEEVGELYKSYYEKGDPHYISLIDNKISVILRNGYDHKDRCRMGIAEFAITPEGNVFPCERLVGNGNNDHKIGNIFQGIDANFMFNHCVKGKQINEDCLKCGIRDYCMNWCGCSNYMTSGYYNRVSSFLCHSEKNILQTSLRIFQELEENFGPLFYEQIVGNAITEAY